MFTIYKNLTKITEELNSLKFKFHIHTKSNQFFQMIKIENFRFCFEKILSSKVDFPNNSNGNCIYVNRRKWILHDK